MTEDSIREVVHRFYVAWAKRDKEQVTALLAEDLDFRSAQDRFVRANEFLESCWKYSEGLAGVSFLKEVYAGDQAFVLLEWENEDGGHFVDAEYLRVDSGRVCEALVVNNSPSFGELVG